MRNKSSRGLCKKTKTVLKTQLSSKNKIQANRTLAIPVLRYSFGIIYWHQEKQKSWTEKQGKC
jgi:hypothetical protein